MRKGQLAEVVIRGLLPMGAACAPMIPHGPDVNPGLSVGGSAALGGGPTYENGDDPGPFYLGALGVNVAYGWRPQNGSLPAIRVAAQAPAHDGIGADVYVQVPPDWLGRIAGGVGMLAEVPTGRRMPYAQLGILDDRGYGLNVVTGRYNDRKQFLGYWSQERAQVTWVSAQLPLYSRATVHIHGGRAQGHVKRQNDNSVTPYIDEDRWVNMAGLTLELHRSRQRK
jgi:hypothetical protein